MQFEILGPVYAVEIIARGREIRELSRLQRRYGRGRWRKLKGIALIRNANGSLRTAELHWYEAFAPGGTEVRHLYRQLQVSCVARSSQGLPRGVRRRRDTRRRSQGRRRERRRLPLSGSALRASRPAGQGAGL